MTTDLYRNYMEAETTHKSKKEARIDAMSRVVAPSVTMLFPLMGIIWPLVAVHMIRDVMNR